jgi:hypothetical protein
LGTFCPFWAVGLALALDLYRRASQFLAKEEPNMTEFLLMLCVASAVAALAYVFSGLRDPISR